MPTQTSGALAAIVALVVAAGGADSDEIVKTAQGWRFKKRTTKGDVAPPKPQP